MNKNYQLVFVSLKIFQGYIKLFCLIIAIYSSHDLVDVTREALTVIGALNYMMPMLNASKYYDIYSFVDIAGDFNEWWEHLDNGRYTVGPPKYIGVLPL